MTKKLSESTYFTRSPKSVSISSGRSGFPNMVIFSVDGDIAVAEKFIVVVSKPRLVNKKYQEISRRRYGYDPSTSPESDEEYFTIIQNFGHKNSDVIDQILKSKENNKDKLFEILTFDSFVSLGTYLIKINKDITKYQIENIFKRAFSEIDKESKDDYVEIENFTILFPSSMQKNRKDFFVSTIFDAISRIKNKGINYSIHSDIIFGKIGGKTIGLYYVDSQDLRIDPSSNVKNLLLGTIIHELGHKFMYEELSNQSYINNTFIQLYSDSNLRHKDKLSTEILNHINVDDKLRAASGKYSKENLIIKSINKIENYVLLKSEERPNVQITAPAQFIYKENWLINNKPIQDIIYLGSNDSGNLIEYGWFPTKYSEKNSSEWFAEMFMCYILDLLDVEQTAWFKETINAGRK